jgi:hypothetical protein
VAKYHVQTPDGHIYEYEAPDDATPQQLDAMAREVAGYAKNYPVVNKKAPPAKPAAPRLLNRARGGNLSTTSRTMSPELDKGWQRSPTWLRPA